MARKRHKSRRAERSVHRRTARRLQPFANRLVAVPQRQLTFDYSPWLDDRRFTAPRPVRSYRPLYTTMAEPAIVTERLRNDRFQIVAQYPEQTLKLCHRRGVRREVLFAKGVGGSRRKKRRPTRNFTSSISC